MPLEADGHKEREMLPATVMAKYSFFISVVPGTECGIGGSGSFGMVTLKTSRACLPVTHIHTPPCHKDHHLHTEVLSEAFLQRKPLSGRDNYFSRGQQQYKLRLFGLTVLSISLPVGSLLGRKLNS